MTHSYVTSDIGVYAMKMPLMLPSLWWDMTRLYVTWLTYVCHDSLVHDIQSDVGVYAMKMLMVLPSLWWDMTHLYVTVLNYTRHDSFTCDVTSDSMSRIDESCHMTRLCVTSSNYMYTTWLDCTWHLLLRIVVRRDSSIWDMTPLICDITRPCVTSFYYMYTPWLIYTWCLLLRSIYVMAYTCS